MGSGSAPEVGALQNENMLFVELEAACDLAQTDPNALAIAIVQLERQKVHH